MGKDIAEIYTSVNDRWCGICNKVIPAGVPYVYDYDCYKTPGGITKYKNFPVHVGCKEKKYGTKSE